MDKSALERLKQKTIVKLNRQIDAVEETRAELAMIEENLKKAK